MTKVTMTVNGRKVSGDCEDRTLLVQFIRENLGLTGTPYNSGDSERDQGISKAGNRRARPVAVELAWLWRRHQPDSALTLWFNARVGNAKGRIRRIAIVALARKLMVALWRYVETGEVPKGAVLSPSF